MAIKQFGSRNVFDECVCTELALLSEIPNCEREREKEREKAFHGLLSPHFGVNSTGLTHRNITAKIGRDAACTAADERLRP